MTLVQKENREQRVSINDAFVCTSVVAYTPVAVDYHKRNLVYRISSSWNCSTLAKKKTNNNDCQERRVKLVRSVIRANRELRDHPVRKEKWELMEDRVHLENRVHKVRDFKFKILI